VLKDDADNSQVSIPIEKYAEFIELIKAQKMSYDLIKPIIRLLITKVGVRLYIPFQVMFVLFRGIGSNNRNY
jgi:hypothetical protein